MSADIVPSLSSRNKNFAIALENLAKQDIKLCNKNLRFSISYISLEVFCGWLQAANLFLSQNFSFFMQLLEDVFVFNLLSNVNYIPSIFILELNHILFDELSLMCKFCLLCISLIKAVDFCYSFCTVSFFFFHVKTFCDALQDLVLLAQFKKREKTHREECSF